MTDFRVRRIRQRRVDARVTSIKQVKRADRSNQLDAEDGPWAKTGSLVPLIPPYSPSFLEMCVERSNMLAQCIEAMVTNVARGGYETTYTRQGQAIDADEKEELESFIESPNAEQSLTSVHALVVHDFETYGYAFLEVIRDRTDKPSLLRHAKAGVTRLLPKDPEEQLVTYEVMRGKRLSVVREFKLFRRFAQIVNGKVRYFREFGDRRVMNMDTGEFDTATPEHLRATELIHFKQGSSTYGTPRWINQIPSILGSRESEECNLRYFQDNTVPPMILSVAGGRLTSQSYKDLKTAIETDGIGQDRQHRILLIEAVAERDGLDDKANPIQLKLDKLTDARQSDGLFKDYDSANQAKIRSSFRLPPVAVGLSQDVTFATANVSAFLAESQVYLPLRNAFDEQYNKLLVNGGNGLGLRTVRLASRVPLITNPDSLIKSLTALNVMGAITPRMALDAANRLLQIDMPSYPEKGEEGWEEWMDKPIIFVTKGTASQDGQAQKDATTKEVEDSGEVDPKQPEHGQE